MGAQAPDLEGLDGELEVVHGARGGREVEHAVEGACNRNMVRHVVLDEFEGGVPLEVGDVPRAARDEVVHPDHLVAVRKEAIDQVRSQEASGTGDQHPHPVSPDVTTGGFPIE